jgi:hypothetical protein
MSDETTYLTVADAAAWFDKNERTIRRWMSARLLSIYKRDDGKIVLDLAELNRVERDQRHRNPVRHAKRAQTFAQVAAMTYSPEYPVCRGFQKGS